MPPEPTDRAVATALLAFGSSLDAIDRLPGARGEDEIGKRGIDRPRPGDHRPALAVGGPVPASPNKLTHQSDYS
jgi:hypothetical protein